MHYSALFLVSILVLIGCGNNLPKKPKQIKSSYIQNLEKESNISYDKIINTDGKSITFRCYIKTQDTNLNAVLKQDVPNALHNDISVLLFPSKERALMLDKGYKAMVEEQSYIYGRDANVAPMKNVYKNIKDGQTTGIREVIVH